jgi:hypothetical protein
MMFDMTAGGEIGEDVGAAEGVDRLLRVADEEEGTACIRTEGAEDGVLDGVGILEFVDEDRLVAGAQGVKEAGAILAGDGAGDFAEQVVVGAEIESRLALARFAVAPEEEVALQSEEAGPAEVLQLLARLGKGGAVGKERV